MADIKVVFYLPLRDVDGRDLAAAIEEVRDELYVRFSAWTFLGYVQGAWEMKDGTQVIDTSEAYMVAIEEDHLGEVEDVLSYFKSKTLQEAIYLEIQRNVEIKFF